MGQTASTTDPEDNDIDGEYEVDDTEYDQVIGEPSVDGNTTDAEGSDIDAEGEEVDDDDEGEPVGAVKLAVPLESSDEGEDDDHDADAAADFSSDVKVSESDDSDSSSSESEAENEWQAENGDDEESGRAESDECVYCGEDESNDPNPVFEEYLTCVACGDNAHRQCARNANTLSPDDDAKQWRCTACIQNGLHAEDEDEDGDSSQSLTRRRLSSVPKLARDLLPSHRGADPGGHSVFNDLILPDDPMDGSRSLRKRKSSHEDDQVAPRLTRKKRRSSGASRSDDDADLSNPSHDVDAGHDSDGEDDHASVSEHGSSRLRSSRARRSSRSRPKRNDKRPLVWIEDEARPVSRSLVIVFHLNNENVQKIVTAKPKKKAVDPRLEARRERDRERRDRNRRAAQKARDESPEVSHYPSIQPHYGAPFYAFADKDIDESKNKPYGGILSEADADTSKTYPVQADRKRFEDARLKAEDDWKKKQIALYGPQELTKSKHPGPPSKIKCINFGGWEIDTWHAAPYPEEYSKNKVLYICEFCLKYMNSDYVAWRHKLKCPAKHPPGDEIYRDGKHSFFEVDGRKNPVYCQNLCLLAKLFLGSKTLYYDVEPFLFYVMTENDNYGCHFVGYFSKEKRPSSLNNVSCILVLPIHQRKGYGQFLIEFSYLLTRVEKKTGSPEKPLSDMGLVSYRKYWRLVMCQELLHQKSPISIMTLAERTGMTPDDIVSALEGLRALVRDPVTRTYALRLDYGFYRGYLDKCNAGDNPKINPECLVWTPYVMGRLGQYEDGPALHTVQPREEVDEDDEKPAPEEGVQIEYVAKQNGTSQDGPTIPPAGNEAEPTTPAIPAEDSANDGSPVPGTPIANGSTIALAGSQPSSAFPSIPPTRFEVFPPIPGMPTVRRPRGRPFGSRRRTSTPQRNRNTSLSISTAPVSRLQLPIGGGKASPSANGANTPSIRLRRTRSRLGESVLNGIDTDCAEEGGAVKAVNGQSTRSSTRSPGTVKTPKGKGKLILEEDDMDEDIDAEGEDDDDVEGEMDIDAEGEYDDGMDIVMADA